MLLLTSISDLIQLITGSTLTIHVHASWVDLSNSGATVAPGRTNTIVSSAGTTTIVGSPAASTQRNVKFLSIENTSTTTSESITVQHTDGTNVVQLQVVTLQPGWTLTYSDQSGWTTIDAAGARTEVPLTGRLLNSTSLTSASGTFTTGPSTRSLRIRGVGGGGGGAGCTSVASAASAGGGGGGGGYIESTFAVTPNTGYSYTVGAAGAANSGAGGGNGGNSTFGPVNTVTYAANGGGGAAVATAVTTLSSYAGGTGGTTSNGVIAAQGGAGEAGVCILVATPIVASGCGGSSVWGGGGVGQVAVGNGVAGSGPGAGGSGAATGASTVRTGGAGTAGQWIVDEYS